MNVITLYITIFLPTIYNVCYGKVIKYSFSCGTQYIDVVGYQLFGGPYCIHLQSEKGGSKVLLTEIIVNSDLSVNP